MNGNSCLPRYSVTKRYLGAMEIGFMWSAAAVLHLSQGPWWYKFRFFAVYSVALNGVPRIEIFLFCGGLPLNGIPESMKYNFWFFSSYNRWPLNGIPGSMKYNFWLFSSFNRLQLNGIPGSMKYNFWLFSYYNRLQLNGIPGSMKYNFWLFSSYNRLQLNGIAENRKSELEYWLCDQWIYTLGTY